MNLVRRHVYPTKSTLSMVDTKQRALRWFVILSTCRASPIVGNGLSYHIYMQLLDAFIEKYVLCKQCRNPETKMLLSKHSIDLQCAACGHLSNIDIGSKLAAFILRHPPTSTNRKVEKREPVLGTSGMAVVDDTWAADTSAEAVAQRRLDLLGISPSMEKEMEEGMFSLLYNMHAS
jgi:hypothetical protein